MRKQKNLHRKYLHLKFSLSILAKLLIDLHSNIDKQQKQQQITQNEVQMLETHEHDGKCVVLFI